MFSALKKLTAGAKQDVITVPPDTAGQPMSGSLQKKFSRGVNYNMKIIIKGDRNVGKSCLLQRLQGGGFIETYTPTEEIQVASIQWSFKATEDIVKVEVWDVVDRGKARQRHAGLKLSTGSLPDAPALDAEFLDVYKGTHGVVLMMDVTKSWTFDYVTRELPKVPSEIPVLILGNHCDMSHHRVISTGQATALIETFRENRPAEILYAESSMRNGFGLRLLHKFLGLPFLRLQKETLLALIERNKRDTEICGFEITEFLNSDDADYNKFLSNLSNKRRQIAESNSRVPPPAVLPVQQHQQLLSSPTSLSHSASNSSISSQYNNNNNKTGTTSPIQQTQQELRPTKSIIVGGGQPIIIPGQINVTQQIKQEQHQQQLQITNTNTLPKAALDIPQKDIITDLLQKSCDDIKKSNKQGIDSQTHHRKISSLEEFCPDDGLLDRSFLDDFVTTTTLTANHDIKIGDSDDSDNDDGNPMVAKFNDEPDNCNTVDDNDDDDDRNEMGKNVSNLKNMIIENETNKNDNKIAKQIKMNPLAKYNRKLLNNNLSLLDSDNLNTSRKFSTSSEEFGIIAPSVIIEKSLSSSLVTGYNDESSSSLQYEENSDNNNCWLPEITAIRQSPEGGEDTTSLPNNSQDSMILKQKFLKKQEQEQQLENDDNTIEKQQQQQNHHHSEKKNKHKKHKKDKKEKNENYDNRDDKKKKKRSSSSKLLNKETDLEEFLNGTTDMSSRTEEAYEAI